MYDPAYIDAPFMRYVDHNTDGDYADSDEGEHYYFRDASYNVVAYTADDGTVLERYRYTPYGQRIAMTPAFVDKAGTDHDQWRGFQGLLHDEESGLIENRARMLDPGTGRFLQRDPLGYPDGMNAYGAYHVMWGGFDPWGLDTCYDPDKSCAEIADEYFNQHLPEYLDAIERALALPYLLLERLRSALNQLGEDYDADIRAKQDEGLIAASDLLSDLLDSMRQRQTDFNTRHLGAGLFHGFSIWTGIVEFSKKLVWLHSTGIIIDAAIQIDGLHKDEAQYLLDLQALATRIQGEIQKIDDDYQQNSEEILESIGDLQEYVEEASGNILQPLRDAANNIEQDCLRQRQGNVE